MVLSTGTNRSTLVSWCCRCVWETKSEAWHCSKESFCPHDIWCVKRRPVPVKFKAAVAAGSLKSCRFVANSSRSCTEMGWSFHGGRKQIQWLQLVGIQRYFAYFCLVVRGPKCVQVMRCRIGINVRMLYCVARPRALYQGLYEGKSWHFMLCQMHFWSLLVQLRWDHSLL